MNKKFRQLLALLIATLVLCTSCRSVTIKHNNDVTDAPEDSDIFNSEPNDDESEGNTDEQEAFDEFTDGVFMDLISESSLSAHSLISDLEEFGLSDLPYSLGDFSEEYYNESINDMAEYLDELEEFDYESLTKEQQLTYDILKTDLEDSVASKDFYGYEDYLSPLSGIPVSIPSYFSVFEFNSKQDVIDYIQLINLIPEYYDDMIEYESTRSAKGMGATDFELDHVIDSCNEFLANKENNFLITTFEERISAVSDISNEDKEEYILENKDIVINKIIPTYENLISKLTQLKGTNKTEGGLANYDGGKDYYEYLIRYCTVTDKSITEMQSILEDKLRTDLLTFTELLTEDESLYDTMNDYSMDTSNPDAILEYLLDNLEDFPSGYETNYTINYVPKDIEKYESPAYYYIPHIDNVTNNQIFINGSDEYKDLDLFSVLAHEGFPGHMYQSTYFQNTEPSLIRNLLRYNGYLEGWGLYSELYSYSLADMSDKQVDFNTAVNCLSYDVYCLADIGINYDGWTRKETIDFVTSIGYPEDVGDEVFETLVENPGVYLSYYIGYLEIMELRETAQLELEDEFNIKSFHKFILDIGPAQFEIIRDRFDTWLFKQKNAA